MPCYLRLSDTNALVRAECVHALESLVREGAPNVIQALRGSLEDQVRACPDSGGLGIACEPGFFLQARG